MVDLLLGLGAAVVKVACKVWLKDNEFASDASAEVVDVLQAKISGQLDQRNARRLFEDLEVPVAKKLGGLREHEFRGIPDNDWEAAVLAVGDTLRRARFTDADVFEGDLDPLYLRRKVAAGSPAATRDLSEGGTAVYARLLTECCAYVVELTSTLPRFNAGAFGEILRRQSVILQRVAEVLDRMPAPDVLQVGTEQAGADFAAAYRRQVVSQLDRLELFGVTVSDSVRGYPLSTAYIPLAVSSGIMQPADLFFGRSTGGPGVGDPASSTLRIDDMLANTSRLFLRGEAGSGKTTLLQWLAVRAARQDFPEQLSAWNEAVPFLIRLRRNVGQDLPPPEKFVAEVGRHIAGDMPRGWVHRLLRQGRALLLVDGVDELPEAQRRPARDWLTALVDAFPDARYVVTSRPGAASSTWLDRQGFDAAEVQAMGWPDVQEFVRHWHAAFRAESGDQDRQAQVSGSEATLLDSLYARRHLRMLATSPLLCALLCALNLDRRAQLPEERMEVYAIALDMLLERRDIERLIPAGGPPLSKTSKTLLLEDLAYWLIRNGWSDAPRERVADQLTRLLSVMPRAATDDGTGVLDALILRSGLIREPVAGRIDFVHRTFEEYLAARAAVSEDQIGELIRNAHNDQWREVIVMAAGHAQPRQREELLNGLLNRAEDELSNRQALQTLAVACLETSPQLDQALHSKIQAVAESLLPPKGVRQAEILARIGEPLLDLLAERPPHGQRQAAATVRAASLVGGHAALHIIARCAKTTGQSVDSELMRAWLLFDAEEFAELVLSGSPHAQHVVVSDTSQLPALPHITGLRHLVLGLAEESCDLEIIRDLPALETLNFLSGSSPRDLNPLEGHPSLNYLLIQGSGSPVDLGPLPTLPRLRAVRLFTERIRSLNPLRDCTELRQVRLVHLEDIDQLNRDLPAHTLDSFELSNTPLATPALLHDVPQLDQLESLTLMSSNELRSLEGIEHWAATLEYLSLWSTRQIVNLESLAALLRLRHLDLGRCPPMDLRSVRKVSSLRTLTLSGQAPVDLSGLQGMTSLTVHVLRRQEVRGAELLGEDSKVVRQ